MTESYRDSNTVIVIWAWSLNWIPGQIEVIGLNLSFVKSNNQRQRSYRIRPLVVSQSRDLPVSPFLTRSKSHSLVEFAIHVTFAPIQLKMNVTNESYDTLIWNWKVTVWMVAEVIFILISICTRSNQLLFSNTQISLYSNIRCCIRRHRCHRFVA